jgi:AraC-like DNA-binding protein
MNLELPIAHIRAGIAYMVQEGLSEQALLDLMKLDREQLSQPGRMVTVDDTEMLFNYGGDNLNCTDIGFRIGKWRDSGHLSLLGHIMNCCENVGQVFQVLKRYEVLSGNISTSVLTQDAEGASLKWIAHYKCSHHLSEEEVTRWISFVSKSSSGDFLPKEVHFSHSCQGDINTYRDFFQCPVYFDSSYTGINFDKSVFLQPIVGFNPELLKLLMGYADMIVEKKQKGADNDMITKFILERLPEKVPTVPEAAEYLGISQRTLQRKIKERGTSFKLMIENVRKEYAFSYLLQSNYKISYIAQVLGYAEQSVFHRAFKRWTGLTPGEYRLQHGLK